ncbi:MAG: UDP-N-acetylglucosamine 2-epimerase, partial [Deltaproteobacteria bacterium]|nr:UDP-N-acetylglucosamine 2-epimerase [Deltaproteobacteria bacterium]
MNYLVMHIVGARPNFMKIAPIISAINEYNSLHQSPVTIHQILVHTGQHYDENMSELFFNQLGLPKPDINLEVGSASQAVQTAEIMIRFEKVLLQYQPDAI